MKLQLGIDITDPNMSPANYRSALDKVLGFVDRKRNANLVLMGQYGQPGASPAARSAEPALGTERVINGVPAVWLDGPQGRGWYPK